MRRTQIFRPMLCDYECEVEQEWDDEVDAPPRPIRVLKRCERHASLSDEELHVAHVAEGEEYLRRTGQ